MKTNQFFSEVRNNYVDQSVMCTYVDAWVSPDEDADGQSVAVIDSDGKITLKLPELAKYSNVIEAIVEVVLKQKADKHKTLVSSIAGLINKETLEQIEAARCYIGDDMACICDDDLMAYAEESYNAAKQAVSAMVKAIKLLKNIV